MTTTINPFNRLEKPVESMTTVELFQLETRLDLAKIKLKQDLPERGESSGPSPRYLFKELAPPSVFERLKQARRLSRQVYQELFKRGFA